MKKQHSSRLPSNPQSEIRRSAILKLLAEADDEARALVAGVRLADDDDALYRDVEHLIVLVHHVRHAFVNLHELAAQGRRAPAEQVNLLPHHPTESLASFFCTPLKK